MSAELLRRLLLRCDHQFSWPRQAEDGQHYQVCLNCGSTYRYDWSRMRRLARVTIVAAPGSRRPCSRPVRWTPRSRRLHHEVTVLLRLAGSTEWFEGTTENVSASGLLLRAPVDIPVGTPVELALEMPREIIGKLARVVCWGAVVRSSPAPELEAAAATFILACSISQYRLAGPREIAG